MNFKNIYLSTLVPALPKILNDNNAIINRQIGLIYNASTNQISVGLNTTGRVKGATAEFVTGVFDTLVVKQQFTNLLSNNTTADEDYYNTYNGDDASYYIDSSTGWDSSTSNIWDSSCFSYIDVISPYYKIKNDVSIAFNTETLGQVVEVLFDISAGFGDFNIRLDGSTSGNKLVITAADASAAWLQLICVDDDPSLGNTWIVKQYGGTFSKTTW